MINYKISEHLKKQLDNSKHNKYKEIQNFIYELLNPPKRMPYHLELQNFLGWIDSPEFMIKQIEGINDFCPICHDKLRTHNTKRFVECIEKLMEITGSQESRIYLDPRERN